ncbi:hypothetical protein ACHAQH_009016 [Verticillium albo-atrum]
MHDNPANPIGSNGLDFGSYTCENEMNFDALQPSRGNFNYGNADRIVAQARANGLHMRCHTLIWHSQVPAWVSNGNFDRATMISILETHIRNVVTHFKGSCYAWDVINEALNEDGTYRTTKAADPNAKLYYNDHNCDRPGRKSTGAQNLLRMVKSAGAPIDSMGLQGHFTTGQTGSLATLTENLGAWMLTLPTPKLSVLPVEYALLHRMH